MARDSNEVYLDYQSAKPVDPRVVEAMLPYFTERFGNPASLHAVGDRATEALEESRARRSPTFVGAESPDEIVFTSGATESNNLALIGYANRNKRAGDHVVISEVEHISLLNLGKYLEKAGFRVTRGAAGPVRAHQPRQAARSRSPTRRSSSRWLGEQRDRHRAADRRDRRDARRHRRRACTSTPSRPRASSPSTWPRCRSTC